MSAPASPAPETPAAAPAVKPAMAMDMLTRILATAQDQIRFADSKAGFVAAFHALLFNTVISTANRLLSVPSDARTAAFWIAVVMLAVYGLVALAAVSLIIISVMSRSAQLTPSSKVFFGHVLKEYGANYRQYARDIRAMTDEDWIDDLSGQVIEVAHIAAVKHRLVRRAALCTLIDLLLWMGVFIVQSLLPRV